MTAQEPTLKSQYAEKVTADLALNTAEQERIRKEISSLQEDLTGLEQDHELLVGMRAAIGDTATAVPAPRTGKKTAASVRKPAAKTATTADAKKGTTKKATAVKAAAKKPVAKKPVAKQAAAKQAPASKEKPVPLTELIHRHLSGQTEPKTAREIAQALTTAHPDRNLSDNLVRTTTERLVARSLAERAKQGSTVYYTAIQHTAPAAEAPAAVPTQTEHAPVTAATA
ncbi:hypothetical protein [Streptomyces sp. NBC_01296]|uniref:hypothetical protein n=1 Tax=Streptomyces sp. NBC_01296 TaxID=2903816 RepID=UPI002E138A9A|nr:hypothetical protein OG299_03140 [Streptomyces sp. NBC_01296]